MCRVRTGVYGLILYILLLLFISHICICMHCCVINLECTGLVSSCGALNSDEIPDRVVPARVRICPLPSEAVGPGGAVCSF